MVRAKVKDGMNSNQTNCVHMIFGQPVKCVVDEETPYAIAVGPVEVNRFPPRGAVGVSEAGGEVRQVVAFRAEMVVHDIEHNRQSKPMAGVYQFLELGRAPIGGVWRIQTGSVITPVAVTRKFRDRHKLNRRDSQVAQIREPRNSASKRSLRRECTSMEFVGDEFLEWKALPTGVRPGEGRRIHDAR